MDLREKVTKALELKFPGVELSLWENDGLFGYAISSSFIDKSSLDRQEMIDNALAASSEKLSKIEIRRVMFISALTPSEFKVVSAFRPLKKKRASKPKTSNRATRAQK